MDAAEPALDSALREQVEALAPKLAAARCIVVSTGAGVSAESGVPTFRDAQTGLWAKYDPVMLASIDGFRRDPATVWKWYDERRQTIRHVQPNPGHYALARWENAWRSAGREFQLITQNIDDLHGLAGSREIIELHGNIWWVRPLNGAMSEAFRLDDCPLPEHPPHDAQGQVLRPHVVWFGEQLDRLNVEAAFDYAERCDALLVAGTSAVVFPAAALPGYALRNGAIVVEVNPHATEFSRQASACLRAPSGVALPALVERVLELAKAG
jgi:NAD-dependent deacetylase